jgi:hypothetical protein
VRLLGLLGVTIAVVAVGCSGGDSEQTRDVGPLTAGELAWVRDYSEWAIDVNGDEYDAPARATVVACEKRLERIGAPPTERLEPAAQRAVEVCPLLAERGMRRRALDVVEEADDLILPFMRDEQELALATGTTDESRADTRLSDAASDVIGDPVEVRCWTDQDWRRVVSEDNAWNDANESHLDLVGWTATDVDRIHLILEACNSIVEAEAGADDIATWSRSEKVDVADAIETLLHEIQHFVLPDASEAKVECSAIRELPEFTRRFGLTPALADELTELYRSDVYPELDDEYTRDGCPRS